MPPISQLLAAAVLTHELLYLAKRGWEYCTISFLPALGVRLEGATGLLVHGALIAVCIARLATPAGWVLDVALLVGVTLVAASHSWFLSNHLVVVWFMVLAVALSHLGEGVEQAAMARGGVQIVVLITYAAAVFHKLNHRFMTPRTSCAAFLAVYYYRNRQLRPSRGLPLVAAAAPAATIAMESLVPILLAIPGLAAWGVAAGIVMHLFFGFLGPAHFSVVMFAGLSAFLYPGVALPALGAWWAVVVIAGGLVGYRFGIAEELRWPWLGRVLQVVFSAFSFVYLTAVLYAAVTTPVGEGLLELYTLRGMGLAVVLGLGALFALNAAAPYLGWKTEFSITMFSNIRPDESNHYMIPVPERLGRYGGYVRIWEIEGLEGLEEHPSITVRRAVRELQRYEHRKYSAYFLNEAFSLLGSVLPEDGEVRVRYGAADGEHTVRVQPRPRPAQKFTGQYTFVPYVLPLSLEEPYVG